MTPRYRVQANRRQTMRVPILKGYRVTIEYEWAPQVDNWSIPRLKEIGWKPQVTLHDSPLGHEIRLSNGTHIGYVRESNGAAYAVTVNGICTRTYRKPGYADIQGALNELGDLIVAKKTRRKPLGRRVTGK